jgi:hypothetical protein
MKAMLTSGPEEKIKTPAKQSGVSLASQPSEWSEPGRERKPYLNSEPKSAILHGFLRACHGAKDNPESKERAIGGKTSITIERAKLRDKDRIVERAMIRD